MSEIDPATTAGWFSAAGAAIGTFFMKLLLGRYMKKIDTLVELVESMDGRLRTIEGRMIERDHFGHRTNPGDKW